jgi:exopolysaccharide biosynthesis polyprenyl glycosylphosphotransferase
VKTSGTTSAKAKTFAIPSRFSRDTGQIPITHRAAPQGHNTPTLHLPIWLLATIDVALVSIDGVLAYYLRFAHQPISTIVRNGPEYINNSSQHQYAAFLLLYAALTILVCMSQDLYRVLSLRTRLDECYAVTKSVAIATFALSVFIYLVGAKPISRLVLGVCATLNVITLIGWRLFRRFYIERRLRQGYGVRNALIIGTGEIAHLLAEVLDQKPSLGWVVVGFLDESRLRDPRCLGVINEFLAVCRRYFIDDVFITLPSERQLVKQLAAQARAHHLNVHVIPDLYDGLGWGASLSYIEGLPVLALYQEPISTMCLLTKRFMDIVVSVLGLVLLGPLLLIIALAIKVESPGPLLYRSRRIGSKGREFTCLKFRTMVADADEQRPDLEHLNERTAVLFKISNDPRITRVGKLLRKYSLDELPQFLNVLIGDMSLVGPRPPVPGEVTQYDLEHLRRLDVAPGITGLWQIKGRRDPSFFNYVALDLEYIENWTLWLDFKILLQTVPEVLRGSGQ